MPTKKEEPIRTLEREAHISGLFKELHSQVAHYLELVRQLAELQARVSLAERSVRLIRDSLQFELSRTDEEVPKDWQQVLDNIRFVGTRLGDACIKVLQERKELSTAQLLDTLNEGQFRFRTGTPLRELNAALLRQPNVTRVGEMWRWIGPEKGEYQEKLRLTPTA